MSTIPEDFDDKIASDFVGSPNNGSIRVDYNEASNDGWLNSQLLTDKLKALEENQNQKDSISPESKESRSSSQSHRGRKSTITRPLQVS